MKRFKFLFSLMVPALVLILAACGNKTPVAGNPTPTPNSTPTATSTPGTIIHTMAATIDGKSVTLLTNDKGWTLYYFTDDTATTSKCTDACAKTWPPLTSSGTPTSTTTLPSGLSLQTNGNGSQVTYNGHPLYTYAQDTPGTWKGQGLKGKWFVATTDLKVITGAIGTASVMINGTSVTVLTNDKGWTIYYFTPDTTTKSNCTGACAKTWPPLTSKETPVSTATLSGTFGLQTNDNGSQVTYNGHPLYTYAADGGPGQTKGQGLNGKWYVATTDLAWMGGSNPAPTPTSSSGYNY